MGSGLLAALTATAVIRAEPRAPASTPTPPPSAGPLVSLPGVTLGGQVTCGRKGHAPSLSQGTWVSVSPAP